MNATTRRSEASAQQQNDHAGSPAPSEPVGEVSFAFGKGVRWYGAVPVMGTKLYTHPAPSAQSSKAALSDEPLRVDLPECVVDTVATSMGLSGPFSRNFYDFAQALMHEVCARVPSAILARAGIGESRREPLTDERIVAIVREASLGAATRRDGTTSTRIARGVEAAHGITPQAGKESGE